MMVLLSPSKTMELRSHPSITLTQPVFDEVGAGVFRDIQGVKKEELQQWMKLSPALTEAVDALYHKENRIS